MVARIVSNSGKRNGKPFRMNAGAGNFYVILHRRAEARWRNSPERGRTAVRTATLVQAFVIPSGSMERTFLVGDHVLSDKLVYAPSDAISRHLLPYPDVEFGEVIVFRHPLEPDKDLVKRAIGVPGDRIRL